MVPVLFFYTIQSSLRATSAFRVSKTFSTGLYYESDIVGLPVVAQG